MLPIRSKKLTLGQDPLGFTLVEVFTVTIVLALLYSVVILAIKPSELKTRARDVVRIADLNKYSAAIEAYVADNGRPPDAAGVTRTSLVLVGTGPLSISNGQGWLGANLYKYLETLPIDPLNKNPYFYRYRRINSKYEFDAPLEYYSDEAANDGGNSSGRYEKGTDLTIL